MDYNESIEKERKEKKKEFIVCFYTQKGVVRLTHTGAPTAPRLYVHSFHLWSSLVKRVSASGGTSRRGHSGH